MIHLGALVNLTDVHGSTPFMDVLSRNNPAAAVTIYKKIGGLGKVSPFPRSILRPFTGIPESIPKVNPEAIPEAIHKVNPEAIYKGIPEAIHKFIPGAIPKVIPEAIAEVITKYITEEDPEVIPGANPTTFEPTYLQLQRQHCT
jgi:hypothetical protein